MLDNKWTCERTLFRKGDLLEVESTMGEWWMAVHKANGKRGYIPSNYVEAYRSHRAEP